MKQKIHIKVLCLLCLLQRHGGEWLEGGISDRKVGCSSPCVCHRVVSPASNFAPHSISLRCKNDTGDIFKKFFSLFGHLHAKSLQQEKKNGKFCKIKKQTKCDAQHTSGGYLLKFRSFQSTSNSH